MLAALSIGASGAALAEAPGWPDMGKLLATGGASQVEGAGGGGLTPWALITGYGTRDSYGANLHWTAVETQDYALRSVGIAAGIADRIELSFAKQEFGGRLAPLDRLRLRQDIVGLKLRVAGDAVYDQDRWLPQIAIGAMLKRHGGVGGLAALGVSKVEQLGARRDRGTDYYLAATKILLDPGLLLNATVRATKANQMGLMGFGGDRKDDYRALLEVSAAYLLHRQWVAGIEYRMKPRNLSIDNERDYRDAFVAWFPNKHVSLTAAYVELGDITIFNPKRQKGWYLSLQTGF
ncbi:MAG TPA: DUF3034 family protein [Paucimonas sp.]|nr:DUF3034 family protein [Paucimonas sp.]